MVREALNSTLLFTGSIFHDVNMIYPQNSAQPKVPRYWPAVKFRKISKDVLQKLQKCDDTNSEDKVNDLSDDGDPSSADTSSSTSPEPSTEFLIDLDIDINSAALLDMISEEEVVSDKPLNTRPTSSAATAVSQPLTVDEAFAMWD